MSSPILNQPQVPVVNQLPVLNQAPVVNQPPQPPPVILTDEQLKEQFNAFLERILGVYDMDTEIKEQIKATMQKLNVPDKIKFMADAGLQDKLITIDNEIKTQYGKIKQYIKDDVWIEFMKNIIQLQVLVFLRKIPLNQIIKPFEDALGQKIAALVSTKQASDTKTFQSKYMRYKKKYLALK